MRKGIIYVYFNRAKYEKEGIEKYYVGQTIKTIEQRAGKDGTGYHWDDPNCNSKFARSIRKWGWDAFEGRVLEEVYEEDLNELEKFYIEQFDSYENGYNSTLGGDGNSGYIRSEESKKKISISIKNHFQDTKEREKLSKTVKTYWENPELRKRQSEMQKKRFEDEKERKRQSERMSIAVKKRFEDPKEREKASKVQKKRYKDKKEREKISGEKNGRIKSVYCKELNIIFSYVKLAEKYCINVLNSKIGLIRDVCNGYRKSSGKLTDGTKLTWKWVEDVDQETLNKAEYIDSKKYEEILSKNVNVCNK